jgi:hypothetical protein
LSCGASLPPRDRFCTARTPGKERAADAQASSATAMYARSPMRESRGRRVNAANAARAALSVGVLNMT